MPLLKKIINKIKRTFNYPYIIGKNSKIEYPEKISNPSYEKEKIIIGNNTILRCEIQILGHGGEIRIGDYCFIGNNSYLWSGKKIQIGDRVLIGHNCNIFDNDIHPIENWKSRHEQYKEITTAGHPKQINLNDAAVVIENDVWIGANVTILKGVRIGQSAVVGANSLVLKDVEPFTVNAGNPSKIIRRLQ